MRAKVTGQILTLDETCRRPSAAADGRRGCPRHPAGTGRQPGSLKRVLVERTEGNPFFLEGSVRTLVETGVLIGEPGAYWLVQALPTTQVPATVQAVLAARIYRLPSEEKQLLQAAAVIGTEVPFPLLEAIAELPEAALHRGLAHLQAAEFLYETRLFAEAYGKEGRIEEGVTILGDALNAVHKNRIWFNEAEILPTEGRTPATAGRPGRIPGGSLLPQGSPVARRQQAKSWELRAALSLSRLWQQQGKRAEARQMLAEVYGWFTEGFDTPDLQEANAVLDALA